MSLGDDFKFIKSQSSEAALYEQLAEECVELAHACLKKSRLLRGESPTSLTVNDIDGMVEEEYTDVFLVSDMLDMHVDPEQYWNKVERWAERLS